MRRTLALVVLVVGGALSVPSTLPAGPNATTTAKVRAPEDGNVTVAHVVVTAVPGNKGPLGVSRPPEATLVKGVPGIAGAASFTRDPGNARRFHATVVLVNPTESSRRPFMAGASSRRTLELGFVAVGRDREAYRFVVQMTQVASDVTYAQDKRPPWATTYCDPPGARGDATFADEVGIGASTLLDVSCDLLNDRDVDQATITAMGLRYIVLDFRKVEGDVAGYLITFHMVNTATAEMLFVIFPEDRVVMDWNAPSGWLGGTVQEEPNVVVFLSRVPSARSRLGAYVRLDATLDTNDAVGVEADVTGRYPYRYTGL